jgi:hypothetical protein
MEFLIVYIIPQRHVNNILPTYLLSPQHKLQAKYFNYDPIVKFLCGATDFDSGYLLFTIV